jgi:hypothetical protein
MAWVGYEPPYANACWLIKALLLGGEKGCGGREWVEGGGFEGEGEREGEGEGEGGGGGEVGGEGEGVGDGLSDSPI